MLIDIHDYYTKLANGETVPQSEIVDLLKELEHFRNATAYLASCQAATLESLPASASKSSRRRHIALCETASELLVGDASRVRYPSDLPSTRERCHRAVVHYKDKEATQ